MKMKRFIAYLIVLLKILLILLPILADAAPLPKDLSAASLGSWIGQIVEYWLEIFDSIRKEVIDDEAHSSRALDPRGARLCPAGPGRESG